MCNACATGKLILRPSPLKIHTELLKFLNRIQGDICGLIQPLCEPFRYFMVLIDASTRLSHVCLLSTRNHAFAKFMMQAIRLKANFSKHQIQSVWLDNAVKFLLWAFNDYCMTQRIQVQYSVPYVHTQNSLAESLIKRIKLISRPLIHNYNFSISCWGHAVLHTPDLIQLRPIVYHSISPLYLIRGNAPSISHMRKFTSLGPHTKLGIYVGYHSLSIIKYLEPLSRDLFIARYADCIFNENHFPALGENTSAI
jgi:hypothetical protein